MICWRDVIIVIYYCQQPLLTSSLYLYSLKIAKNSVSDPPWLYADPDPAFSVNADTNSGPVLNIDADADSGKTLINFFQRRYFLMDYLYLCFLFPLIQFFFFLF
jgi:hypothetical protein